MTIKTILEYCLETLFPRWCAVCNCKMASSEEVVCYICKTQLPYTNYHNETDNKIEQTFWGRVRIERATALLYYTKGSKVGNILWQLKYSAALENGVWLGKILGNMLKKSANYNTIDYVIGVPLHKRKQQKRGFNQADIIAKEIAKRMNLEHRTDLLIKIKNNKTQTKKRRLDRWQNAQESYVATESICLNKKHILLVDDVITTGATIEACCEALHAKYDLKISIASAAYTY